MAEDPIVRLAELKLIKDSADLEAEISSKAPGWFIHIYRRLRRNAAEAMAATVFTDEMETKQRRDFQVRVRVYDAFMQEIRQFIADGISADQNMTDAERQETLDNLVEQGPDGESIAYELGLLTEPPGTGTA